MADQLPSAIDPVSGNDWTVLAFLQAVRSDLASIKSTLASPAPAKTGSTPFPNNAAGNPVLATDATDWQDYYGLSSARVAVADHVTASYGLQFMIPQTPGPYDYVKLPVVTVTCTAGQALTVAVDVSTTAPNITATLSLAFGTQAVLESGGGSGISGYSVNASIPSTGAWTRVELTGVTMPAGYDHFRPAIQINGVPDDVARLTLADYLVG